MNVKLKKFSIVKPKVKITIGMKTIARESHSGDNVPLPAKLLSNGVPATIVGDAEMGEI